MQVWQDRVKELVHQELSVSTLAAFNTNVDAVVHLSNEDIKGLCSDPNVDLEEVSKINADDILDIYTANEFVAVLKSAFRPR